MFYVAIHACSFKKYNIVFSANRWAPIDKGHKGLMPFVNPAAAGGELLYAKPSIAFAQPTIVASGGISSETSSVPGSSPSAS